MQPSFKQMIMEVFRAYVIELDDTVSLYHMKKYISALYPERVSARFNTYLKRALKKDEGVLWERVRDSYRLLDKSQIPDKTLPPTPWERAWMEQKENFSQAQEKNVCS